MFGNPNNQAFFEEVLQQHIGKIHVSGSSPLGGGCINDAFRVETEAGPYMIKYNSPDMLSMFEVEAKGLQLLHDAGELTVPAVHGHGTLSGRSYIIMDFIDSGARQSDYWEDFGRSLARMHKHSAGQYGLDHDNYIGALPQYNEWHDKWVDFFIEQRLKKQVKMARDKGAIDASVQQQFEKLYSKLPEILPEEQPSLLHGDLWSGNVITDERGYVALVDPGVYYGHREIELAFTQMFGGFSPEFYRAYEEEYPLVDSVEERVDLYNLYPLMVHVNLFGGGYLSGVKRTLERWT